MKKILFFTAAILCLLLLAGCNTSGDGNVTTPVDQDTTVTNVPDAPDTTVLNIISDKSTEYIIVRPDTCSQSLTDAASAVRTALMEHYELDSLKIISDYEQKNFDISKRAKCEILIGNTNREESAEAIKLIKYNDFIIKVIGEKLVITGGNDDAAAKAALYFIENYIKGDSLSFASDFSLTVPAEYSREPATLLGKDISEFTIVYSSAYKSIATTMADELGKKFGSIINIAGDSTEPVENEIIIGSAKRGVAGKFSSEDYLIRAEGTKIYIGGGSLASIGSGCRKLLNIIGSATENIGAGSLSVEYHLPAREEYIEDISKLAMHWDIYSDTPDWMLDFDEKVAAMNDPSGRMMSCLHRGDMVYYPENSIEGIISAIRMGGDMIEIDPHRTADGVLVLMHDDTLTRMTNWADLKGKNGLPTSAKIADWTYEQLMQLNLKNQNGGDGALLTQYKIPTLEEAIKVCAERILIRLDVKKDAAGNIYWDFTNDIWPMIQKYNAYTTVIFTWHSFFTGSNYSLVKKYKPLMEAAAGRSSFVFTGTNAAASATGVLQTIKINKMDYCVRLTDCNFSDTKFEDYLKKATTLLSGLRGKARVYIDAHGNSSKHENKADWDALYDAGINVLLVNHGFELCRYIGQNYSPSK